MAEQETHLSFFSSQLQWSDDNKLFLVGTETKTNVLQCKPFMQEHVFTQITVQSGTTPTKSTIRSD